MLIVVGGLAREGGWPRDIGIKTDEDHAHYDTRKKDVWSVGITMVEMITGGRRPWKRADHAEYTDHFLLRDPDYLLRMGVSPDADKLLRRVFVPKDTDRITARQFLEAVEGIVVFVVPRDPHASASEPSPEKRKNMKVRRSIGDGR